MDRGKPVPHEEQYPQQPSQARLRALQALTAAWRHQLAEDIDSGR